MWYAANATKSNLMMMWWTPEPLYQTFLGSDAELQHVLMNPYTLECSKARNEYLDESCELDLSSRVGPPEASCANPAESLSKLITYSLYELINDPDIPEAAISPAYDALRRFRISDPQLGELFSLWEKEPSPRDGVCTWAVQNLEFLMSMIPYSYPRVIVEEEHSIFGYIMIGLGALATTIVIATTSFVSALRQKDAIRYAQLDFLYLILTGSFLACIGAILSSVPPTNGSCMVRFNSSISVTFDILVVAHFRFSLFSSEYRMVPAYWIHSSITPIGSEGIRHQSDGSCCETYA